MAGVLSQWRHAEFAMVVLSTRCLTACPALYVRMSVTHLFKILFAHQDSF